MSNEMRPLRNRGEAIDFLLSQHPQTDVAIKHESRIDPEDPQSPPVWRYEANNNGQSIEEESDYWLSGDYIFFKTDGQQSSLQAAYTWALKEENRIVLARAEEKYHDKEKARDASYDDGLAEIINKMGDPNSRADKESIFQELDRIENYYQLTAYELVVAYALCESRLRDEGEV